jgi:hypothetical protein
LMPLLSGMGGWGKSSLKHSTSSTCTSRLIEIFFFANKMYTENLLRELSFSKKVSGSSAGNSGSEPSPPPLPGGKGLFENPVFPAAAGEFSLRIRNCAEY